VLEPLDGGGEHVDLHSESGIFFGDGLLRIFELLCQVVDGKLKIVPLWPGISEVLGVCYRGRRRNSLRGTWGAGRIREMRGLRARRSHCVLCIASGE
jgi:hypothetical protein